MAAVQILRQGIPGTDVLFYSWLCIPSKAYSKCSQWDNIGYINFGRNDYIATYLTPHHIEWLRKFPDYFSESIVWILIIMSPYICPI